MDNCSHQPLLLNKTFDDLDDLAATARAWDLDYRQIDRGRFRGEIAQVGTGNVILSFGRFERALIQRGAAPSGLRTIVVPADTSQRFLWRGQRVDGKVVLLYKSGDEFEILSRSGFACFAYSITDALLADVSERVGLEHVPERLESGSVLRCDSSLLESLRRRMAQMCSCADSGQLTDGGLFDLLEQDLAVQCAEVLASADSLERTCRKRRRDQVVQRLHERLKQNVEWPLTIGELCLEAQVSERTLRYAFQECFAVSPKRYLQAHRLNAVREELRNGAARGATIASVAGRWGFWHMGQFAQDYSRQFGELPSQTLLVSAPAHPRRRSRPRTAG